MSERLSLASIAAFALVLAADAVPFTGYYYPSSLQVGTKTRVVIGGMSLRGLKGAWVSGEGVKITKVTIVPGFPRAPGKTQTPWVVDWIYDCFEGKRVHRELPKEATAADTDWPKNEWWSNVDKCDELDLQIMMRFIDTPEFYPQPTPALDGQAVLDVEVAPDAPIGRRDILVYDRSSCSPPYSIFITKAPHVREPFYHIPPREAHHRPVDVKLHWPNDHLPVAKLPVVLDGQIWPGECDVFRIQLEKGRRVTLSLTGRELIPYLGDAVPGFFNPAMHLFDPKGKEVAFSDDYHYLPDPIISYDVKESGVYRVEIHDNLYRGFPNFVYFVECWTDQDNRPFPSVRERAFRCFPQPYAHQPPKEEKGAKVFRGVIDCPGRVARHTFTVNQPGRMAIELFARRDGSPLDGILRVNGPLAEGQPPDLAPLLATLDDIRNEGYKGSVGSIAQSETDPIAALDFTRPGRYCVSVVDSSNRGGDEFAYTLRVAPWAPYFEVYSLKSSFLCGPSRSAKIKLHVLRRNGFKGEITISGNEEFSADGTIEAGESEGEIHVSAAKDGWKGMKRCRLNATATINGREVTVPVMAADEAEQAFAWLHALAVNDFFFLNPEDGGIEVASISNEPVEPRPGHSKGKPCSTCHSVVPTVGKAKRLPEPEPEIAAPAPKKKSGAKNGRNDKRLKK